MSMAAAKCTIRPHRCAGQSTLTQLVAASPSARTSGCPHAGQSFGNFHRLRPLRRFASTGPTTSGITSPALRTMTVSPTRTSLRATSSSLCNVACWTVEPPTKTGSSRAKGGARPQLLALTEHVDLHDDAVDLVAEVVAMLEHSLRELVDGIQRVEPLDLVVHGEAEVA